MFSFNKDTMAKVSDFGIISGVCQWGVCIPLLSQIQRDDLEKNILFSSMEHFCTPSSAFCSVSKDLSGLLVNNELKETSP